MAYERTDERKPQEELVGMGLGEYSFAFMAAERSLIERRGAQRGQCYRKGGTIVE